MYYPSLKKMLSNSNNKQILRLFVKTIKIGRDDLMTNKKNGLVAFCNGRSKCLELTPKIFNCKIQHNDLYFDFNETFDSGLGHKWNEYTYDIPEMNENNNKLYSTICKHNKNICGYGDKLALLCYMYNKNDYSPKFAYEQGFNQMSFIASGFYLHALKSNNFNEFVDNLTKYNNDSKQKKQIISIAQTYWGD